MATKKDFVVSYGLQTDKDTAQGAGLNALFVDSVNNKVGIGTNSPLTNLHISDGIGSISSSLYTTDYLTISAQGTAPGFNIISSSSSSAGHRGVFKATRSRGTLASPAVPILNDNTFSLLGAIYDGSTSALATAAINMDVDGSVTSGNAPQRITFWTGPANTRLERLRITSGGNVGIGTTNPGTNLLQVQGNTYITGNLVVDGTLNASLNTNSISQLNTSVTASDTGTDGTITFTTDGTAAATISNTQQFGIGTTNPQDKLEINSLNGTDVKLRLATDNSTFNNFSVIRGVRVSNSQSQLEFQVSNGGIQTGLSIAQDGVVTVGQQSSSKLNIIGDSSDQPMGGSLGSLLNVYSNTAVSADSGGSISLGGIISAGGINRAFGVIKGYKENATDSDGKGYLSFLTHTGSAISEAMRINSSQNIGIGTINPLTKLHVFSADPEILLIERTTNNNTLIQYKNTGGSMYAGLGNTAAGWGIDNDNNITSGSLFFVDTSGNTSISGNLTLAGNFTVKGTTTTINSNVTTLDDPIITLGGDTSVAEVTKDRGIEFKWGGVAISVSNYAGVGTALVTANVASTTGYATGDIITISGATGTEQAKLNGTWMISVLNGTQFSFSIFPAILTTGTYSTTIGTTVKSNNGFFGFDQSAQRLTFIPRADAVNEVYAGTRGDFEIGNIIASGGNITTGAAVASNLFGTTTTAAIEIGGALTTGTIRIGSTTGSGAINIGNTGTAAAQTVNIATATTGTITIGGPSSPVSIAAGSGTVQIGTTTAAAQQIIIGSGTTSTISIGGTGSPVNIATGASTGAIQIGSTTASAQNITIGGTTTGTINIGSVSGANTINVGSTSSTAVNLPTGKTKVGQTFLLQGGAVNITLPTLAGTLYASGNTDVALTDGGTNASLTAVSGGVVYSTASAMAITAAGNSGDLLVSKGTAAPAFESFDLFLHAPHASYKSICRVATTADLGASTFASNVLTGYDDAVILQCTTTAGSAVVTTTSTAGIKVGATVSGNANIPASRTITSIDSATQFTINSGSSVLAGTNVNTTFTQTIAALTIDGVALAVDNRVLVKDQSTLGGLSVLDAAKYNGIYKVTATGSTTVPWTLTRTDDANVATDLDGAIVNISEGTSNYGKSYKTRFKGTDTLNTTEMLWSRIVDVNSSSYGILPVTKVGVDLSSDTETIKFKTGNVADLVVGLSLGIKTVQSFAASTYTTASTLYIEGAPSQGTNATITTAYALQVASGNTYLGGNLTVNGGTITTGNVAATLLGGNTTTNITIGGALTTGTLTLGSANGSGTIAIGNTGTAAAQAVNIATATTGTITIGGTGATAVQLPTGKTKVGTSTLTQGSATARTITFPDATDTLVGRTTTDTLTNKTLTAPRITSASHIADSNGNELIKFPTAVASAVNEITISNAPTGIDPTIEASGSDTDVGLGIYPKGVGYLYLGKNSVGSPLLTVTQTQFQSVASTNLFQGSVDVNGTLSVSDSSATQSRINHLNNVDTIVIDNGNNTYDYRIAPNGSSTDSYFAVTGIPGPVSPSVATVVVGSTFNPTNIRSSENYIVNPVAIGRTSRALTGPVTAFNTTPTVAGLGYRDGVNTFLTVSSESGTLARVTLLVGGGIIRSVVATPLREGATYRESEVLSVSTPESTVGITSASGSGSNATVNFSRVTPIDCTSSGSGTAVTLTFAAPQTYAPYPVGSTITVTGLSVAGHNGTFTVTGCTTTTVTYTNATTGSGTGGTVSIHPFTTAHRVTITLVTPANYNATNAVVISSTATSVTYAFPGTATTTPGGTGTLAQGTTVTTTGQVTVSTVREAGLSILNSSLNTIRLEATETTATNSSTILGNIVFSAKDTNSGGSGDKVQLRGVAEGTQGGGRLEVWTSQSGLEPSLGFAFTGTNEFKLYDSTGTFSHTFTNSPTGNRTLTIPDVTTTLVGTDATQTLSNKTYLIPFTQGAGTALTATQETTNQPLFPVPGDTITLAAGVYEVKMLVFVTRGATSITASQLRINLLGAGTAAGTFTGIAIGFNAGTGASTAYHFSAVNINTNNTVVPSITTAAGSYQAEISGIIKITTAGTFIPAYGLTAALAGATTTTTCSATNYMRLIPISTSGTTTVQGGWS